MRTYALLRAQDPVRRSDADTGEMQPRSLGSGPIPQRVSGANPAAQLQEALRARRRELEILRSARDAADAAKSRALEPETTNHAVDAPGAERIEPVGPRLPTPDIERLRPPELLLLRPDPCTGAPETSPETEPGDQPEEPQQTIPESAEAPPESEPIEERPPEPAPESTREPEDKEPALDKVPPPRSPQPQSKVAPGTSPRVPGPLVFEIFPTGPSGERYQPADTPPGGEDPPPQEPSPAPGAAEPGSHGKKPIAEGMQPPRREPDDPPEARKATPGTDKRPAEPEQEAAELPLDLTGEKAAGTEGKDLGTEPDIKADEPPPDNPADALDNPADALDIIDDETETPPSGPGGGGLGKAPELDAWKSRSTQAAVDIHKPDLGPMDTNAKGMREHGKQTLAKGQARRKELPKEAKPIFAAKKRDIAELSKVPADLKDDPVGAVKSIKRAAGRHRKGLPPQKLPLLKPTDRGFLPNLYGDPISPADLAALKKKYGKELAAAKARQGEKYDEMSALMKAFKKDLAKDPTLKGRIAVFEGQTISGVELPPKPEIAPEHQPHIAAVLARIITESGKLPKAWIEKARKGAYANQALSLPDAFPTLGDKWVPKEAELLRAEMQRVREAAGISKEQLDKAIADRQEELKKGKTKSLGEGDKAYEEVKGKVEADFETTQGAIQGLREEWEDWADEIAARESGVDWKAIRDRQHKMERAVEDMANDWIVGYDDMRKARLQKLQAAAGQQKKAYEAAIKKDKELDLEDAGDDEKKIEAINADKKYANFVEARMKELGEHIGALDKSNIKHVEAWQKKMREVRKGALDRLQKWGDKQIGRSRSWLDDFLARIYGWRDDQKSEARAFAKQRARETTAAMGSNLGLLYQKREEYGDTLDKTEKAQLALMSEEQRTVIETYYANGKDTIGAVAAGMNIRLRNQRVPKIEKAMTAKVLTTTVNSNDARKLMRLSLSGFGTDAGGIAIACKQGFNHRWGTDEDKIHGALGKVAAKEVGMAVRGAYWLDTGEDFNTRLKSELAGGMFDDEEEYDQARAQLEANKIDAAAAELRVAMEGAGTDEDKIKAVLRRFQGQKTADGKPIDLELIKKAYARMYNEPLNARLKSELSGSDLGISTALAANNEEQADAIELKEAQTGFWGPDKKDLEKVYQRVHDEEWSRGKAQNLSVKEIEANIRKRLDDTSTEYSKTYKGATLKEDYKKLPGNLADLAVGLQDQDWPAVDAARLEIERRGIYGTYTDQYGQTRKTSTLYADDKVINKDILGVQYDRAYEKKQWELERKLREEETEWNKTHPEPWSPAEKRRRMQALEREASRLAQADAKVSMDAFKKKFMARYEPGRKLSEFDDLLLSMTSGTKEGLIGTTWIAGTGYDEAKDRLKHGGYLPPHKHIEYAAKGPGTDKDRLKGQLTGKTKAEIAEIRRNWELAHPGKDFDDMVLGELSGRDRFDVKMMLKHGEPTNPEEALALAKEKMAYEGRTGGIRGQGAFRRKTSEYVDLENQVKRLEAETAAWKEAQKRYPTKMVKDEKTGNMVEVQAREIGAYNSAWQATYQGVKDVVDLHRQAVDADADLISGIIGMAVAVVLAAVLAPFTAGASLAVLALVAAGVAAASTAVTMAAKWAIKGDAYSNDEIAMDLAFGAVDMVVSAATAGIGGKLMRGALAAKLAAQQGGKAASKETLKAAVKEASMMTGKQALSSAAQETAQGLFSVLAVPAFMDEYGRGMNPMLNMVVSLGLGMGTGVGMSYGIGKTAKLGKYLGKRMTRSKLPDTGGIDLTSVRYDPKRLGAMRDEYLKANPRHNADDFLKDYDALLLKQMDDTKVRSKWQKQAREDMLQYVPNEQKARLAETPMELMDEKAFRRLTGSSKGEAVVVIKDGVPTVIIKQGASPTALRRESQHLLQAVDDKWKAHFKRLDEGNLADWAVKDTRDKLRLYDDKLDLEIDAADADLKRMRDLARQSDAPPGLAREITDLEETLHNLTRRRAEVAGIGPLKRTLMAWRLWPEPKYLGQKPRLFTKKGQGGLAPIEPDAPGRPAEIPPEKVILEPYSGPNLESAVDLARRHPEARVITTEATIKPTAGDAKRLQDVGGTFVPENMPASIPVGSVDEIKMRFPIPHERAIQQDFPRRLADLEERFPDRSRMELMQEAVAEATSSAETATVYAPYALQRLKPGGKLEVVFWEKQIADELAKLTDLRFFDPATGKGYRFELEPTLKKPKGEVAPHSGFGVPVNNDSLVNVGRLRKVELEGTGLADLRYDTKRFAAMQDEYLKANPGRSADDFLRDYDALLLKQMDDSKVRAQWRKQARNDMLQHIPKEQKARLADTPIEMMGDKAFRKLTGSEKGEAVVMIKDGVPVVVVRQGASPTALRREAQHLLQAVDDKWKGHFKRLGESNLTDWPTKDVREKLHLYHDKLAVEIDAAQADLARMRNLAKQKDRPPGITREIKELEETLSNLDKRRTEVEGLGPLKRTLMAWKLWPEPDYLDQKPRLFTKKDPGDLKPLRQGEPGVIRDLEKREGDIGKLLDLVLDDVEMSDVNRIINSFPEDQQDLARQALHLASQSASSNRLDVAVSEMWLLHSVASGSEGQMPVYAPQRGSLGDVLLYLDSKELFTAGEGGRVMRSTPTLEHNTVVLLDGVVMRKIETDLDFVQSLIDNDCILVHPPGFTKGIHPFMPKSAIETRVRELVKLASRSKNPPQALKEALEADLSVLPSGLSTQVKRLPEPPAGRVNEHELLRLLRGEAGLDADTNMTDILRKGGVPHQYQGLVRELLAQQADPWSLRRMGTALAEQHEGVLAFAGTRGIQSDEIHYFIPRPDKSFDLVAMGHRLVTGTSSDRYIVGLDGPHGLRARHLGPKSMIVVLDDLAGSAQTMVDAHNMLRHYSGEVVLAPLVTTEGGRTRITNLVDKEHFIPHTEVTSIKKSPLWESSSPAQRTDLQSVIGSMGYGNNALSIVFPYMAPNNANALFSVLFAHHFILGKQPGKGVKTQTYNPPR